MRLSVEGSNEGHVIPVIFLKVKLVQTRQVSLIEFLSTVSMRWRFHAGRYRKFCQGAVEEERSERHV